MDIASILQTVVGGASKAARREVDRYTAWLLEMGRFAQTWPAVAAPGLTCGCRLVTPHGPALCRQAAIGSCAVCQQGCCLEHAALAPGVLICASCVSTARVARGLGPDAPKAHQTAAAAAKPGLSRADHLKVLRLKAGATEAEVRARYRELVKKNHPDHAKTEPDRLKREARMREVNAAYAALTTDTAKAAA